MEKFSLQDRGARLEELRAELVKAQTGNAESSRRVAELYEGLGQESEAESWWRTAAKRGEPDAVAYVKDLLDW